MLILCHRKLPSGVKRRRFGIRSVIPAGLRDLTEVKILYEMAPYEITRAGCTTPLNDVKLSS